MAGNKTGTDLSIFTELNNVKHYIFDRNSKTLTSWLKKVRLDNTGLRRNITSSKGNDFCFRSLAIWVQTYVDKAVN